MVKLKNECVSTPNSIKGDFIISERKFLDAVTSPNTSYTTTEDLPYADADASPSGSSFLAEHISHDETKQMSPSKEHHTHKHKKSPEHSPVKGSSQSSPTKETRRKSLPKNNELVQKHEEISTDFRNLNKQKTDSADPKRSSGNFDVSSLYVSQSRLTFKP